MRTFLLAALLPGAAAAAPVSFDFLARDPDARAVGLAGAYCALASDAAAMHYNPAGLAFVKRHEAAFMSARGAGEQAHHDLALALRGGAGLSLRRHSFEDVPVTTLSQPGGTGAREGAAAWAGAAGYGRRLWRGAALGAAVKYAKHTVAGAAAGAAAADLGLMLRPEAATGLSVGASVSNLGDAARRGGVEESLPRTERLGAAYERPLGSRAARVALELARRPGSGPSGAAGVELEWTGLLRARAGWDSAADAGSGLAFGFGVAASAFDVDYAAASRGPLGYEHWLSARVRFGGPPEARETVTRLSPVRQPRASFREVQWSQALQERW